MRPIAQYALYFVAGFLQLWLLLFVWGLSAGPANAMPYILLLAFLELGVIASGLSLFLEKLGALAAVLGGGVGLWWPLVGLLSPSEGPIEAAIIGVLPLIVTMDGCWRLVARRQASWLEVAEGPSLLIRTALGALPLVIVGVIAFPLITAVEEKFLIPHGYMGEVAIVFHPAQTVQNNRKSSKMTRYEIPEDGVLLATGEPTRSWRRTKYFYRYGDGSLQPIETVWTTTIHDTPENRADPTVGIYLRANGVTTSGDCRFEHETFLVGTKAFILHGGGRRTYDLHKRMQELACGRAKAR